MNYSFTKAKPKKILRGLTKAWFIYTVLSLAILFLLRIFFSVSASIISAENEKIKAEQEALSNSISELNAKEERFGFEMGYIDKIGDSETRLEDRVFKVMSMIPSQILFSRVNITKDGVYIKGVTPSRELYLSMLQSQLRSVFDFTNTHFYRLSDGWYNFETVSRTQSR